MTIVLFLSCIFKKFRIICVHYRNQNFIAFCSLNQMSPKPTGNLKSITESEELNFKIINEIMENIFLRFHFLKAEQGQVITFFWKTSKFLWDLSVKVAKNKEEF